MDAVALALALGAGNEAQAANAAAAAAAEKATEFAPMVQSYGGEEAPWFEAKTSMNGFSSVTYKVRLTEIFEDADSPEYAFRDLQDAISAKIRNGGDALLMVQGSAIMGVVNQSLIVAKSLLPLIFTSDEPRFTGFLESRFTLDATALGLGVIDSTDKEKFNLTTDPDAGAVVIDDTTFSGGYCAWIPFTFSFS